MPSWEEVASEQGRFVYSLAYRLTGSPADAEDLAQDVLLRVRSALAQYRPGSLEGWVTEVQGGSERRINKEERRQQHDDHGVDTDDLTHHVQ